MNWMTSEGGWAECQINQAQNIHYAACLHHFTNLWNKHYYSSAEEEQNIDYEGEFWYIFLVIFQGSTEM